MSNKLVIREVPDSIRLDAWWLGAETNASDTPRPPPVVPVKQIRSRSPSVLPVLLVLVLIADLLFWGHGLGVSIAIFALSVSAAILGLRTKVVARRQWLFWAVFEIFCNLPVIEFIQPLSLMFTFFGLAAIAVWAAHGRIVQWWHALWFMFRASTVGAVVLPVSVAQEARGMRPGAEFKRHARALILPAAVGLVFLALLTAANPILEQLIEGLASLEFLTPDQIIRAIFWFLVASFVWPYLNLNGAWVGQVPPVFKFESKGSSTVGSVFNADSVRNSLFLFNAMFLVQTVLDVGVLSGGTTLPDGVTYAKYAHRGAYPLAATALLAGLFAIASHKLISHSKILRGLLYLWLAQTMFLVLTAVFRLSLYVDTYSLTYLRVRALIWMGLVFVGLVLTLVKIGRDLNVGWLIRSNLISLGVTLYTCCFVNFAYVIADYNHSRWADSGRFDVSYLCRLGEQALPVILEMERLGNNTTCGDYLRPRLDHISDWQEWGFRRWRLHVYLGSRSNEPRL